MKKAFTFIMISIIFLCLYIVQSKVFGVFTIAGVKPNLFIVFALFLGLFLDKYYTPIICAFLGFILDLFSSSIIGINAIILLIACVGGMLFTKNFSKDTKITIMIISIIMTLICEVISYILRIVVLKAEIELLAFLKLTSIEILYNTLLIIIFYPLIQRFGLWLERTFTNDKILTRYF